MAQVRHYVNAEMEGGETYIIPNRDTVVLGGTLGAPDDYDCLPRAADRAGILERAARVLPSLRSAEVVSEWVRRRVAPPPRRLPS